MPPRHFARNPHGSLERKVREAYLFEEKLREFLEIGSSMTTKELEIALARLADTLHAGRNDYSEAEAKEQILNIYYQLRLSDLARLNKLTRIRKSMLCLANDFPEYLIRKLCGFSLPALPAVEPYAATETESFADRVRLLSP
jgi:hypothetical protein